MKMVNKASHQQRSPSNMTISTREVVRTTIRSVSKRHLVVMPKFFREFISEIDVFRRLSQMQLNRKDSSSSSSNSRKSCKAPRGAINYLAIKRTNRSEVSYSSKESNQPSGDENTHSHQGRKQRISNPRVS